MEHFIANENLAYNQDQFSIGQSLLIIFDLLANLHPYNIHDFVAILVSVLISNSHI